ncbi:fungal-specific transcription factor domain-containing protein [Myxozyma melibiosi]|uniref:Fungal-specific transcription factor domain-containing protein n=1 Tax=Myxozyma melibiosi TaxID=54550 RepID=A0ABR1FDH0_9ASCO
MTSVKSSEILDDLQQQNRDKLQDRVDNVRPSPTPSNSFSSPTSTTSASTPAAASISSGATTKRSCVACRKRHMRCQPLRQNQSGTCVWCYEHGIDCFECETDTKPLNKTTRISDQEKFILDGDTSAYGGFQFSSLSFLAADDPDAPEMLHLHQLMQKESYSAETLETEQEGRLCLDPQVENHLLDLYYSRVHPYIPIVPRSYLESIVPSQVLLAAMYGVASRLPNAVVSSRDFHHIKRVLQIKISDLFTKCQPSLQECQAFAIMHMALELQSKDLGDVESCSLYLAQAIRISFDLRLHQEKSYRNDSPLLREVKRRTFWALFTQDKWTSASKGYPVMIYPEDVAVQMPDVTDIDDPFGAPHEYFIELIYQAHTLAFVLPFSYSSNRFERATVEQFQTVEKKVLLLASRAGNPKLSDITRRQITLSAVAIKLLFYAPFFRPTSSKDKALFRKLIPSIDGLRMTLAQEAVTTVLKNDTVDLLFTGPSIWSVLFFANARCFLAALSVKYDHAVSYEPQLRENAELAIELLDGMAHAMTKESKWCYMAMAGNVLRWSKKVAESKAGDLSWQEKCGIASKEAAQSNTPSSVPERPKREASVAHASQRKRAKVSHSAVPQYAKGMMPGQQEHIRDEFSVVDTSFASPTSSSSSYHDLSSRQSSVSSTTASSPSAKIVGQSSQEYSSSLGDIYLLYSQQQTTPSPHTIPSLSIGSVGEDGSSLHEYSESPQPAAAHAVPDFAYNMSLDAGARFPDGKRSMTSSAAEHSQLDEGPLDLSAFASVDRGEDEHNTWNMMLGAQAENWPGLGPSMSEGWVLDSEFSSTIAGQSQLHASTDGYRGGELEIGKRLEDDSRGGKDGEEEEGEEDREEIERRCVLGAGESRLKQEAAIRDAVWNCVLTSLSTC